MSNEAPPYSVENLLSAIEATSTSLTERSDMITTLEATNYRLQEENDELRSQVDKLMDRIKATRADLRAATQRADRAEANAAANLNRVNQLRDELVVANDDVANISTAVSNLLVR